MKEEIWKPVKGFEGLYEISSLGRIKRLQSEVNCRAYKKRIVKEKILKGVVNSNGYLSGNLSTSNKKLSFRLHRLIALHFIPNPDNKPEVNHIDGNKLNNALENLEWVTHQENGIHAYKNGLNYSYKGADNCLSKAVSQYTLEGGYLKTYGSIHEAARETGIHKNAIGANLYGKTKKCGGFKWAYA